MKDLKAEIVELLEDFAMEYWDDESGEWIDLGNPSRLADQLLLLMEEHCASLRQAKRSPETSKPTSLPAASATDTLTDEMVMKVWDSIPPNVAGEEIVLIAPNKKIYKIWEKEYPGIKIILQRDYKGYPLPTHSKQSTRGGME